MKHIFALFMLFALGATELTAKPVAFRKSKKRKNRKVSNRKKKIIAKKSGKKPKGRGKSKGRALSQSSGGTSSTTGTPPVSSSITPGSSNQPSLDSNDSKGVDASGGSSDPANLQNQQEQRNQNSATDKNALQKQVASQNYQTKHRAPIAPPQRNLGDNSDSGEVSDKEWDDLVKKFKSLSSEYDASILIVIGTDYANLRTKINNNKAKKDRQTFSRLQAELEHLEAFADAIKASADATKVSAPTYEPLHAPDPEVVDSSQFENKHPDIDFYNLADDKKFSITDIVQKDTSRNEKHCMVHYSGKSMEAIMTEHDTHQSIKMHYGDSIFIFGPDTINRSTYRLAVLAQNGERDMYIFGSNQYIVKFQNDGYYDLFDQNNNYQLIYNKTNDSIQQYIQQYSPSNDVFYRFDPAQPKHRIAFKNYLEDKKKHQ